jgi:hypothetical protein
MTYQRSFFRSFSPILHDTWTVKGIGLYRLYLRGRGTIDFLTTVNGIENLLSHATFTGVGLSIHFI